MFLFELSFVDAAISVVLVHLLVIEALLMSINNKTVNYEGLELLSANGGSFEINQLLFADDTALVADSEEKLCRLVSEFGRVCEIRKFRVNVGKSKVIRCSRYGNLVNDYFEMS